MATMSTDSSLNAAGRPQLLQPDATSSYIANIDDVRQMEYPQLADTTYLDHAGTTLYPQSLINAYSDDLKQHLFGNSHSGSASSQLSAHRIDDARLQVLRFFSASPDEYDVVFTANATASIKLVGDIFRDQGTAFGYAYHVDSHTSMVGVRELAEYSCCFSDDSELDQWLSSFSSKSSIGLIAYSGQSNMTGQQYGMNWSGVTNTLRASSGSNLFSLLDAAALASTSSVDLSNVEHAPDFVSVSFYKIFGFPDLGALLVRRRAGPLLAQRKYFGGGTVDSVALGDEVWYARKQKSLHDQLEDGTLPIHNIIALSHAFRIHRSLYGSMVNISKHTRFLAARLRNVMRSLKHCNGRAVCTMYDSQTSAPANAKAASHGPVIAFNVVDDQGRYLSCVEFEKLAIVHGFQIRVGGHCNPGGTARHLKMTSDDLRRNYARGFRCGGASESINGRPTGSIRVSLGPMSNLADIDRFMVFLQHNFVVTASVIPTTSITPTTSIPVNVIVESLTVYPVKSCAGFRIPPGTPWKVLATGLEWDRQWCVVHEGTHAALSQKRFPRMAMLQTSIDLAAGMLRVFHDMNSTRRQQLRVPLVEPPPMLDTTGTLSKTIQRTSEVCGEAVEVLHYSDPAVTAFFTEALGVSCTLARFPHQNPLRQVQIRQPRARSTKDAVGPRLVGLANESPILLVSRSSVNRLNEQIKERAGPGRAVSADTFRPNVVISEQLQSGQLETPYLEDGWKSVKIGLRAHFEVLGPCQRCQMVGINQIDSSRQREPLSTLAKTRRRDGKVWFGMHINLVNGSCSHDAGEWPTVIEVGDTVQYVDLES